MAKQPLTFGFIYWLQIGLWTMYLQITEMTANVLDGLGVCACRKFAKLPESLKGKTVVVTGANTGIGKETVKAVAQRGAKVILACRDQTRAQSAIDDIVKSIGEDKRSNLTFVELNLSSLASVRQAAANINRQVSSIDVLINNAGVMMCPEWTTADGYEYQFGTNHLGHFLLTQLLVDKIKQAPAGARIVNVSSLAHMHGQMYWDNLNLTGQYSPVKAYGRSKLANIYFTRVLAKRLASSKVNVYALHPGIIATELARHIPAAVLKILVYFRLLFTIPEKGAQTSLYCGFDQATANQTGQYYANCALVKNLGQHVTDDAAAEKLWDLSLKLCDVEDRL